MTKRYAIAIMLIAGTALISFGLPKPKYESPEIISKLDIPKRVYFWDSADISKEINLGKPGEFNFVSDVFARHYSNKYNEELVFMILDAGNFHNPKICMGGAGFAPRDLEKLELATPSRKFKADVVYFQKGDNGYLTVYWICIDKKQVDWATQKVKELFYSMFNKKKTGLMMRVDIIARPDDIKRALLTVQEFVADLSKQIPAGDAEYVFGR